MIDQLDSSVVSKLATYFAVSDLSSLSQVSSTLRDSFGPYLWRKVFVIPHEYLHHGTDKAFKMYEYQVISVKMVTELDKYQWIKRNFVRELVLSPMCGLVQKSIIDQINIQHSFPCLQSIYGESHNMTRPKNCNKPIQMQTNDIRYCIWDRMEPSSYPYREPSPFTDKVVSTIPRTVKIVNLLLEDEMHLYSVSNLEILTSLHVTFANIDSDFVKLTGHLKRCTNLQRFIFTPLVAVTRSQYSLIYTVINNCFPKLKFLKLLHRYESGGCFDNLSNITTVQQLSNKNIECFEVCMLLKQVEYCYSDSMFKSFHDYINFDLLESKIDLTGVHGLEIEEEFDSEMRIQWPLITRRIYAPDLKHFRLRTFTFGRYFANILLPAQNNLVTLNVGVMYGYDLWLFVSCLAKFKNLKSLVVQWADNKGFCEGHLRGYLCRDLLRAFSRIAWKYDLVYSHVRDGDIENDGIKQLSDESVQKLIVHILIKSEPRFCEEDEDEGFIETMAMLIKCPEKLVKIYGNIFKPVGFNKGWDETLPKGIKLVPFVYSFWDSVFNVCKDLTKLEVLKVFEASIPFVSPHFSNLVHNHKSKQLKSITIGTMRVCSRYILPNELNKLTYGKYVYQVVVPFANRKMLPFLGLVSYVDAVYEVDIESMKKDFKGIKRFRKEEINHGQWYLFSTFKQGDFQASHQCYNESNSFRLQYLGSKEISDINVNVGHNYAAHIL